MLTVFGAYSTLLPQSVDLVAVGAVLTGVAGVGLLVLGWKWR